ncbi:MAG: hypothetical protein K2Q13_01890 [Nitrosomonas sp.]|uniref:hypothetical protein n=1 Tax=Nitrosomonas sp. TaxID=42353 RepID=UPI0025F70049|nr:hypothetical protein [Nitrosomonas sp.]MBY0473794.1 hypothetical protein [Nitrosomonas sp.]
MNFSEFDVTRRTRKGNCLNQIDDPIETVCKNKRLLVIDLTLFLNPISGPGVVLDIKPFG